MINSFLIGPIRRSAGHARGDLPWSLLSSWSWHRSALHCVLPCPRSTRWRARPHDSDCGS